ncbi:hypothetical protein Tco_0164120 [Tanacetum coccineum]
MASQTIRDGVTSLNRRHHGFLNGVELLLVKGLSLFEDFLRQEIKDRLKEFRINKWYQSLSLRIFDLEDMELESTNSGSNAKLPILKLGEYEMWAIRIKQYFQIQDYALWEVIENGDFRVFATL